MPRTSANELPTAPRPLAAPDPAADAVRWLFPAYIFLILVAFFVLRTEGVMPRGTSGHDRAVFQAVNAATLTGFQLSIHPSAYFLPGKILLLALTVAGTLFTLIVGGLAVKRICRLPWSDARLVNSAFLLQGLTLAIGAILGLTSSDKSASFFDHVFSAAAAFANSGLYVSPAGPPSALSPATHLLLLPMGVIGGLGLTVILELFDSFARQRPLSRHAKIVLTTTALIYLGGTLVSLLLQALSPAALAAKSAWSVPGQPASLWRTLVLNASFGTLNASTLGLPVAPVHREFPPLAVLTIVLMAVGASPGGTGGGLKTTALHALFTGPRRALAGLPVSRAFGIAAAWLGLYTLAALITHTLLLRFAPQLGSQTSFLTISALSNSGLSFDAISTTGPGLYVLSAAMFFGRIVPLLILWWMADSTQDADTAIG